VILPPACSTFCSRWTEVELAIGPLDFPSYQANRVARMAVEREFIIIGEAMLVLSRIAPDIVDSMSASRRIVNFRNQLTHEYPTVDDRIVWRIIEHDVPVLRRESKSDRKAAGRQRTPSPAAVRRRQHPRRQGTKRQ